MFRADINRRSLLNAKTRFVLTLLFTLTFIFTARAQSDPNSRSEFWPEIDIYVPLNEKFRLFFLASVNQERDTRGKFEGQLGAHLDYTRSKRWTFRVGYRYGHSLGDSDPFTENRIITEQTYHHDLPGKFVLHDRNRQDFRWVSGDFSFRYRNRVMAERPLKLLKYDVVPYASAEIYYDSRFSTFNRTRLIAGTQITLKKNKLWVIDPTQQRVIDIYYARQDDNRSSPRHVNAIGLSFSIYF